MQPEQSPLKRGWITSVPTHVLGERVIIPHWIQPLTLFPYFYLFCHKNISSLSHESSIPVKDYTEIKTYTIPSCWCFQIYTEYKLVLDISLVLVQWHIPIAGEKNRRNYINSNFSYIAQNKGNQWIMGKALTAGGSVMYVLKTYGYWNIHILKSYGYLMGIFPSPGDFFSPLKTLFLQNEPPRWMIPEHLLIYLFLVAQVWCTIMYFSSATKPGTKTESFWIFQWCVLLFTEGPSILAWPYGFPKKCRNFFIQSSTFTPGIGLHHFPRAPEATVTHGSNGRVKGAGTSAGLAPKSPLQILPSGVPRDQQDPHTRILGFLSCLKKMWQTTKQTTKFPLCVWGRWGFHINSAKFDSMDTTDAVLLELWDSSASWAIFSLSQPWDAAFSFDSLQHYSLQTRNVLDVQRGKIWQSNTKKRDINSLVLCAV